MLASSRGTLPHCELLHQNPRLQTDPPQNQRHADPRIYRESACLFLRVYLKSRKFSLFLQTQRDFALNSLEIHKGFLRLFALNPACACEISVIFFVFRYTLVSSGISIAQSRPWDNKKELPLGCGSSRLVLFTAPNSRSCSPARQCAARPCTGGSRGSRSWRNPADWWGRRWR